MSAPFPWPSKAEPTSRVISSVTDWQSEGILVPHEAIRWWNAQMLEIIDVFDPLSQKGTEWKTKLFFDWFDTCYFASLHHHHDAEEKLYTPGIAAKLESCGKTLPSNNIGPDHELLIKNLEQIKSYRSPIMAGDAKALNEFKAFMRSFVKTMEDHLAEEEEMYPKALRDSGMTQEEEGAIIGKIIAGLGLEGNKKFLPCIIYVMCMWNGEEKAMSFMKNNVPPPIQMLFWNCWISDFHENQLKVLDALKQTDEYTPQTPVCGCTLM
jgi:hemerythrin-like domain-containing protein